MDLSDDDVEYNFWNKYRSGVRDTVLIVNNSINCHIVLLIFCETHTKKWPNSHNQYLFILTTVNLTTKIT